MSIGHTLRDLRLEKKLSQLDIEKRCGLTRYYVSRIENSTQDPSIKNLMRFAMALGEPFYAIIYRIEKARSLPTPRNRNTERYTNLILMRLPKLKPAERNALLAFTKALAARRPG